MTKLRRKVSLRDTVAELMENGMFEDLEQGKSETFSYIEGFYNRVRIHSGLGNLSPEEFEKKLANEQII